MMTMIHEYLIHPIEEASGGEVSGFGIIARVVLFLLTLFAVMYGLPLFLLAL